MASGERSPEIRQRQGLSQCRTAKLSGPTRSATSTIGQNKVGPAISTLQKLLKVYGLSSSEFFPKPRKSDEPQVAINQDDLIEMGSQDVSTKLVRNGNPNRTLTMIFETYQPGITAGKRIKRRSEGIDTVLEGEIVLTTSGQDYHLVAGRSYAINIGMPHSFGNTSAGICRIINTHTSTTFQSSCPVSRVNAARPIIYAQNHSSCIKAAGERILMSLLR